MSQKTPTLCSAIVTLLAYTSGKDVIVSSWPSQTEVPPTPIQLLGVGQKLLSEVEKYKYRQTLQSSPEHLQNRVRPGGEGCVCAPMQRERAVPPGIHLGQGDYFYPLCRLPVSSWHHLMSISIFSALGEDPHIWYRVRQSVLELSLATTGEEKCSLNKRCAEHSVPGINCSAVASFGGATQKAVKASKKSQHTQCCVDKGRSKFNGLHELSSKPSADFSIFSGTFSFWHRSDIYRS